MNRATSMLSRLSLIAAIVLLASAADAAAPQAKVTPLMSQALPDFPGKEAVMITVEYPPGAVDPVHRHDADAFVYVLEGAIVMQVKGGEPMTLSAGQSFYEAPGDIHTVGRNASQTEPAQFLVVLLKDKKDRKSTRLNSSH